MTQTVKLYRGESVVVEAPAEPPATEGLLPDFDHGFNVAYVVPLITMHRARNGADLGVTMWVQALEYTLVAVDGQPHSIEADDYAHGIGSFILVHMWDSNGDQQLRSATCRAVAESLVTELVANYVYPETP